MSKWSEEILMEQELQVEFNRGYSWAQYERKLDEIKMWQEYDEWAQWSENNRFILEDGQIIDGKINP